MGILYEIGQWRKARPIDRETTIRGPNRHQTIVWSLLDQPGEVGVITKIEGGKFLDFHVEKDKSFGVVAGVVKRRYTLESRKGGQ